MQANQTTVASLASEAPAGRVPRDRQVFGRLLIGAASAVLLLILAVQVAATLGLGGGLTTWRTVAVAYAGWSVALCVGLVWSRGLAGERAAFLLPAVLLTVAFVIFPTFYALFIAFSKWNLSGAGGREFNGLANFRQLFGDRGYWNAVVNMAYYLAAVAVQYLIAFALALTLNQNIRGQKFFRVVFLLPFMLSPVAVSFMIGRSILNSQYGPIIPVLESLGFQNVSFYEDPWPARLNIMLMDAWYSIPFLMVLLLAGLQAIPPEVLEAARIDGAAAGAAFRTIVFPLMLPVSITALVLRIIFEFKLLDVVRVVTNGNPGGATDTVSLFIFREGIEQQNVGYATALSQFYLLLIVVSITLILWGANAVIRRVT